MIKNINLFSKLDARNKYGIIAQIAVPLPISIELTYYVNKNSSNPTLIKEEYSVVSHLNGWNLNYLNYTPKKEDYSIYYHTEDDTEPNIYLYFGNDITGKSNNQYFYILYNCKNNINNNTYNVTLKYADSYSADIALVYPIGKEFWASQYSTDIPLSIVKDNFIANEKLNIVNSTTIETLLNNKSNLNDIYLRANQVVCFKKALNNDHNFQNVKFYIFNDAYRIERDLLEIIKNDITAVSIVGLNIKPKIEVYISGADVYIKSLGYIMVSIIMSHADYNIVNDIPEGITQVKILNREKVTVEELLTYRSLLRYTFLPYLCDNNLLYREHNYIKSGTFTNKPTKAPIGFAYFCTDKQTGEGATDGITIYYKGNDIWVDALGRVVDNNNYPIIIKGTTIQRPTLTSTNDGFEYYDTTLKKKILWNGTAWVNLDGTELAQ